MNSKVFLIDIITTNKLKEWHYEPNTEITIPVRSNNYYNALRKFENTCWGSEYPSYRIVGVRDCDTFLFCPMLEMKTRKPKTK
jgi:hypothetical protein